MAKVAFETMSNHDGTDVQYPYYPECPHAGIAYNDKRCGGYRVLCTHPKRHHCYSRCLTHHICDYPKERTACPMDREKEHGITG